MPPIERVRMLAQKWLDGNISPEEEEEFAAWYNQFDDEEVLVIDRHFAADKQELKQAIAGLLNKRIQENERVTPQRPIAGMRSINWKWSRNVAAVLAGTLLISGASLYYFLSKKTIDYQAAPIAVKTILPGKNGALLTLADGTQMDLDSMKNGVIATQQGAKVALKDGKVKYDKDDIQSAQIAYNTMTTPRGRQYQLTLSDGTQVWLNAASSIKYPTVFAGPVRKVSTTGEVYFEVAKDKARPFIVNVVPNVAVEVLGTHFDVNAYPDEDNISTTLLEGSIKTMTDGQSVLLRPGEQARIAEKKIKVVDDIDLDMVVSWKSNSFLFDSTRIDVALRQLSRWYNVDVEYEKNVPNIAVGGELKKNLTLDEALSLWKKIGLKFEIKDKKLIVYP
jgi:transmembrane sensor